MLAFASFALVLPTLASAMTRLEWPTSFSGSVRTTTALPQSSTTSSIASSATTPVTISRHMPLDPITGGEFGPDGPSTSESYNVDTVRVTELDSASETISGSVSTSSGCSSTSHSVDAEVTTPGAAVATPSSGADSVRIPAAVFAASLMAALVAY